MKLSSFSTKLPEKFEVGSVNIFVGGNGVGKSTLMREIFNSITGRPSRVTHWLGTTDVTDDHQIETARKLVDALTETIESPSSTYYQFENVKTIRVVSNKSVFRLPNMPSWRRWPLVRHQRRT